MDTKITQYLFESKSEMIRSLTYSLPFDKSYSNHPVARLDFSIQIQKAVLGLFSVLNYTKNTAPFPLADETMMEEVVNEIFQNIVVEQVDSQI